MIEKNVKINRKEKGVLIKKFLIYFFYILLLIIICSLNNYIMYFDELISKIRDSESTFTIESFIVIVIIFLFLFYCIWKIILLFFDYNSGEVIVIRGLISEKKSFLWIPIVILYLFFFITFVDKNFIFIINGNCYYINYDEYQKNNVGHLVELHLGYKSGEVLSIIYIPMSIDEN